MGPCSHQCHHPPHLRRLWVHPDEPPELAQVWYQAYHALFWVDVHLNGTEDGFLPPPPFELIEQDEYGPIPARPYTREELLGYLAHCRQRCQSTIAGTTDEEAQRLCWMGWGEVPFAELLLYSMRHLAGHTAQLNLLLGQTPGGAPDWVTRVDRQRQPPNEDV